MITKIKILDGGKGKAVNPFVDNDCTNCGREKCECLDFGAFERDNPAYDIISPLSVKVGDEIPATLVWQYEYIDGWKAIVEKPNYDSPKLRQAWQLTPEKEEEENYSNSFDGTGWKAVVATTAVDERKDELINRVINACADKCTDPIEYLAIKSLTPKNFI